MLGASPVLNTRLFVSAKTIGQIPVVDDLMEDVLIQISLDLAVRVIEFIPSVFKGNALVTLDAIAGVRGGDNFVLDVAPPCLLGRAATTNFESLGFRKWSLDRQDILAEPRVRNARTIWFHRHNRVPVSTRMEFIHILQKDGPMPIRRLATICRSKTALSAVLSLACANVVGLDFSDKPLGEDTIVRPLNR